MRAILQRLTETDEESPVGKVLRLPLRLVPPRSVLTIRGGINRGAKWIAGSSLHSCWLGTYEAEKQDLVRRLVKPGMRVWDVGANAGFYTVAFSRLVGEVGHVLSFEPFAENADNILRHMVLNGLENVTLVQAALSGTNGLVGFRPGRYNAEGKLAPGDAPYLVPSWTVDKFLHDRPSSRPDLIKIDVEGAEADLLSGAAEFLTDASPVLIIALHGEEVGLECFRLLKTFGYESYNLDGSSAAEIARRRYEIFATKDTLPGVEAA